MPEDNAGLLVRSRDMGMGENRGSTRGEGHPDGGNRRASVRVDQCVASTGVVCSVASSSRRELVLCEASSANPAGSAWLNRSRQSNTVGREVFNSKAIWRLSFPAWAKRQILERRTIF
jgi:hypothetical protein